MDDIAYLEKGFIDSKMLVFKQSVKPAMVKRPYYGKIFAGYYFNGLYMPGLNGIEITQQILAVPPSHCGDSTVNEGDDTIAEALRQGAKVSLIKICSKEIINALNQLLLGKIPLAKSLNRNILNHLTTPASKKNYRINGQEYSTRNPEITPREKEVLEAMARGMNNREIAAALYISENTVKNHVRNILDKMDVKSRTQAVAIWMTQGLID